MSHPVVDEILHGRDRDKIPVLGIKRSPDDRGARGPAARRQEASSSVVSATKRNE